MSFEPADLAIAPPDPRPGLLADLDLPIRDVSAPPSRALADSIDRGLISNDDAVGFHAAAAASISAPAVAIKSPKPPVRPSPSPPVTAELPLFVQGLTEPARRPDQEELLVKVPRAPRAPLAVRRPTPAPGRVREKYQREVAPARQAGLLERDLLDMRPREETPPAPVLETPSPVAARGREAQDQPAGALRRIEAACVDLLFIGPINVAVVWLTLQRCDLTFAEAWQLPMLPLLAYLFLVDSGYLLMFTLTNGQTVGKMAAGLRVIGASPDAVTNDHVTLRQAAVRAILTFPSVLALGLGFAPALLGRGLALHDRFAHTRVVRA